MVLSVRLADFSTFIWCTATAVDELRKATKVIDTRLKHERVLQSKGATWTCARADGFRTDCASIGDQFNRECVLSVGARHEIKA